MARVRTSGTWRRVLLACTTTTVAILGSAAVADAACTRIEQVQLARASSIAAGLRASEAAGGADAAAIAARARRRCVAARFAYAQAAATRSRAAVVGSRTTVLGLPLVGATVGWTPVWRLDLPRVAAQAYGSRSSAARSIARAQLAAAHVGSAGAVWGPDPTRISWDAAVEAAMAATLARSPVRADRQLAVATAAAFRVPARRASLARLSVLEHLLAADRLTSAAIATRADIAASVAHSASRGAYPRVRRSVSRGWSRTDGHWSTALEHRALVTRTRPLLVRTPDVATTAAVALLARALTVAPAVRFQTVPSGAFYPWPRDDAFDNQAITLSVDKPAMLQLAVYDAAGTRVRSVDVAAVPGTTRLAWDGAAADGTIQPPGDYRYTVLAIDLVRNAIRVPGLEQFRIARDTVAPVVRAASVRYATGAPLGQRVVVAWSVSEELSPRVTTTVQLTSGAKHATVTLSSTLRSASVRRKVHLSRGTWAATLAFVDGSGNRATRDAGTFTVR